MNQELIDFADQAIKLGLENGCQYIDARSEDIIKKSVSIENSQVDNVGTNFDRGIGIRVLVNGAWGFCSFTEPNSFKEISQGIKSLIKTTNHYSQFKNTKITLAENPATKTKISYPVLKEPNMDDLIKISLECNLALQEPRRVKNSSVNSWYTECSKYFANSEGSEIIQEFSDTILEMTATSYESGLTQSVNITEGGRGGLELLTEKETAQKSATAIAQKSSELIDARPVKEEITKVLLNPDFVALLTHEILGHPSEGDRVLGREMAWAGGSWWTGKLGEKIGSESLSVFDDPTMKRSLGWYYYDDEGIKAKPTKLIEDGILKKHLQSRETSKVVGSPPSGNMRATSYNFMPLIRMACTCIEGGNWSPEEMVKEIKNGYLISNMKIPSIDMNRYNWSISCQYAQKIENGEITDLLRDVIVMGNSPDFFNSIEACGNDFTVRPITNCGKGDPMQIMMMGNGGPTVSGKATVKGVN